MNVYPSPPSNSELLRRELERMDFPLECRPPTEMEIKRMAVSDTLDQIETDISRHLKEHIIPQQ